MSWFARRTAVEKVVETTFCRPGTVTPTTGPAFAVAGVFHDNRDIDVVTDDVGYAKTEFDYELRKTNETTTHSLADFPRAAASNLYGTLVLDDGGATYDIVYVHEDDSMLFLGLAGPR